MNAWLSQHRAALASAFRRLWSTPLNTLLSLLVFGIALTITSGALAGLHAFAPHAHHLLELSVLVAANLVATAMRFVLLRGWVFHPRRAN